ncbi:hypothetical protein PL11_001870 [Lentilactobacillus curieae]|uniref:Uncharacterized protein n=1 Tax=Lentilactobacillus curieae TaxID=1138822 RepID=A0A1S6QGM9_9LACO|nr:hypothetical protein [Lentilactobacillus curieae]AQW20749.1 hypothetical protein PL11_001870 [Lentilactobacillus curieae]
MKKTVLALLVSAGLFGGLTITSANTEAATWHQGTPKALRGTWKTKPNRFFGNVVFTIRIGKNYSHAMGSDPDFLNKVKYQYLGHHYYKIRGIETVYSHKPTTRYFKWDSKHHIQYNTTRSMKYGESYYR